MPSVLYLLDADNKIAGVLHVSRGKLEQDVPRVYFESYLPGLKLREKPEAGELAGGTVATDGPFSLPEDKDVWTGTAAPDQKQSVRYKLTEEGYGGAIVHVEMDWPIDAGSRLRYMMADTTQGLYGPSDRTVLSAGPLEGNPSITRVVLDEPFGQTPRPGDRLYVIAPAAPSPYLTFAP
jgi:hypothetical protein